MPKPKCTVYVLHVWQSQVDSVGEVIDIQTAITEVAIALKFTVHVVQSFIKGHKK